MCTAGPQPGSCPAQCAPLDLNLGAWDLPTSVCTAGPQRPDRMPEDMPDGMSDKMPEDMPDRMPEDMPDRMPEGMPDRMPDKMSDRMPEDTPDKVPECLPDRMPEDLPDNMPEDMPDRMPDRMPEDMPGRMPEDMPDRMPEGMPDRTPDKMSDRMPDLPVTKCINVMVGITRSKVIFSRKLRLGGMNFEKIHVLQQQVLQEKVLILDCGLLPQPQGNPARVMGWSVNSH